MNESGAQKAKVVFRLSHMGDVALTTGVLFHWQKTRGDSFIFITRSGNTPLLQNHPAIKRIIDIPDEELTTGAWLRRARALAGELDGHTLVDLHGTLRSRILALFWKGDVQRYPKFSLQRRLFDCTHKDKYRLALETTNVPQRYALALDATPPPRTTLVPRLFPTERESLDAQALLDGINRQGPVIALHPYATHPSKQWPRAHWETLQGLLDDAGLPWIIVGRDKSPLRPGHDRDFTNATDLRATCALLAETDLLVTGDSGPMHLAAGVDTPVLALFGPTVRAWGFFPAGPKDRVLEHPLPCRPCSLHGGKVCAEKVACLAGISPDEVMKNVLAMLG